MSTGESGRFRTSMRKRLLCPKMAMRGVGEAMNGPRWWAIPGPDSPQPSVSSGWMAGGSPIHEDTGRVDGPSNLPTPRRDERGAHEDVVLLVGGVGHQARANRDAPREIRAVHAVHRLIIFHVA